MFDPKDKAQREIRCHSHRPRRPAVSGPRFRPHLAAGPRSGNGVGQGDAKVSGLNTILITVGEEPCNA